MSPYPFFPSDAQRHAQRCALAYEDYKAFLVKFDRVPASLEVLIEEHRGEPLLDFPSFLNQKMALLRP